MGSATTQARIATRAALSAAGGDPLTLGTELLAAGRAIGSSTQLTASFADAGVPEASKKQLVSTLFGSTSPATQSVLLSVGTTRWSSPQDLLAGVEELGIRAVATSASSPAQIAEELAAFGVAVSSSHDLEFAVGSTLTPTATKVGVVTGLLGTKASPQTLTILTHLVSQPRKRRIGELIDTATRIVAETQGRTVAVVESAAALSDAQLTALAASLAATHGSPVTIEPVVNPAVLGGVRVQIGDTVIDGTVATRLQNLRLALAG